MPSSRHGYDGIDWTYGIQISDRHIIGPHQDTEALIRNFIETAHEYPYARFCSKRMSHGISMNSGRYSRAYHGVLMTSTVTMDPDSVLFVVPNKRNIQWNYHRPYGTPKRKNKTIYEWKKFSALIKRRKNLKFRIQLKPKNE